MSPKDGNPLCCVLAPKSGMGGYCHLVITSTYCRKSLLQGKHSQSKTEIFKNLGSDRCPVPSQAETTLTNGRHKAGKK